MTVTVPVAMTTVAMMSLMMGHHSALTAGISSIRASLSDAPTASVIYVWRA